LLDLRANYFYSIFLVDYIETLISRLREVDSEHYANVCRFQDVSFCVEPGEVVALVGPSGGGKSSCINLLEHFYEPLSGDILLDGIPISQFDHHFLHKHVSFVVINYNFMNFISYKH
jgi:ABC-type bacteriocin/lantibiotic exporter with double-glycine peptidase domain